MLTEVGYEREGGGSLEEYWLAAICSSLSVGESFFPWKGLLGMLVGAARDQSPMGGGQAIGNLGGSNALMHVSEVGDVTDDVDEDGLMLSCDDDDDDAEVSAVDLLGEAIRDFRLSQRERAKAALKPWVIKFEDFAHDESDIEEKESSKKGVTWLTRASWR